MKPFRHAAACLTVLLVFSSCGADSPVETVGPGILTSRLHVLFVGNSLTYVNDLPGLVSDIARENGDTIVTSMVAAANYALIDHLNDVGALDALKNARWDIVVLQQGPTTLPINRDSLVLWTQMFDPYIRAAGARPALYMVWPDASRLSSMAAVHQSYYDAAAGVNGLFYPAGDAWTLAWKADAKLALYDGDNFHPSLMGSTLAALVMVEQMSGRDARTFKSAPLEKSLSVTAATVKVLLESAHSANALYARR